MENSCMKLAIQAWRAEATATPVMQESNPYSTYHSENKGKASEPADPSDEKRRRADNYRRTRTSEAEDEPL